MSAQQKKSGWFFNKNIIDEINSVPEEIVKDNEHNVTSLPEKLTSKQSGEIKELKRLIFEKEQVFQNYKKEMTTKNQQLAKENENYRQSILRMGEEKVQNGRQIQDLETEIRRLQREINRLEGNKEIQELEEKLSQAKNEVSSLRTSVDQLRHVESEVQETRQKYNELVMERNAEAGQRQEKIISLEKQLEALSQELSQSEEQIIQLDQLVNEKNQMIQQLLEEQEQQSLAIEGEVVSELQHQIMVIQKENDQLKQDAILSQQEIGEVLISARKQANRMVEKAKLDAQRIIQNSESELQTIHERAKEISYEVEESRQAILSIYEELKNRTDQLMVRKLPNSEEVKERFDFTKATILTHKDA